MAADERIVTLDGPAGSGKTSVAREVAVRLGYAFLDTGAMYRAATVAALDAGLDPDRPDEGAIARAVRDAGLRLDPRGVVLLRDQDVAPLLKTTAVDRSVSAVAALPAVRTALTTLQRGFGSIAQPGLVAEGRDMATVVFPHARFRFYLDASLDARTDRRMEDLKKRGLPVPERTAVRDELARRDRADSTRAVAPLRIGEGVAVIDTTRMPFEDVVEDVVARVEGRGAWA